MLEYPLIQIAGVTDQAEAHLLHECGVKYVGFPLRLPVHQEDLSEAEAAEVIRQLRPPSIAVLITYLDRACEIIAFCKTLNVGIVQLHGEIALGELRQLKSDYPELDVIKSLVVGQQPQHVLEATVNEMSPLVDAFITDTFDPATGASGATGKRHDWGVSRRLVELSPRPVILAGGLTPDNVRQAITEVRPAGVDSHTGVEDANGRKCRDKVKGFVEPARAAFHEIARAE